MITWNSEEFSKLLEEVQLSKTEDELNLDGSRKKFTQEQMIQFFEALSKNKSILSLGLACNNIGPAEAQQLAVSLRNNKTLFYLNLSFNNIGSNGVKYLADTLRTNQTLIYINLANNNICSVGGLYLANALRVNQVLKSLNLYDNFISNAAVQSFSESLMINHGLQNLNLHKNVIGSDGAKYLATALETNNTLQNLFLGGNNIGSKGAHSIAAALKINTSLRILDLQVNNIGVEGAKSLAEALKVNHVLENLNLHLNEISIEGVHYFSYFMKENYSLLVLTLPETNLGSEKDKCDAKIKFFLKRNDFYQKNGYKVFFLMGLHRRLGENSSIRTALKNNSMYDQELLGEIFSFVTSLQKKQQIVSKDEDEYQNDIIVSPGFGVESKQDNDNFEVVKGNEVIDKKNKVEAKPMTTYLLNQLAIKSMNLNNNKIKIESKNDVEQRLLFQFEYCNQNNPEQHNLNPIQAIDEEHDAQNQAVRDTMLLVKLKFKE